MTSSNQGRDAERDRPAASNLRERLEDIGEEVAELPAEASGVAGAVVGEFQGTALARWAVRTYISVMAHAPKSTRGKVTMAAVGFVVLMAPSLALLYVSFTAGSESTQAWFGRLGYAGIFLANLAGSATLFIPVPGLTVAGQALIASSAQVLSPFLVGVVGGLGMAVGEVTAYVAGMATSVIAQQEEIKPPGRLKPLIDRLLRSVDWLMAHYGVPTLFILSVIPNPLFEVAGFTAGATRYPFVRFMAALTPGKVLRGLLIAYFGEALFTGALDAVIDFGRLILPF
jgi:membrane protein DedA with SNARE-associated domain